MEIYSKKAMFIKATNHRRIYLVCISYIYSENRKWWVHCTNVIFKQIFSTFTRVLSVQQVQETNVFPRASQSDVPLLFSLLRFSLIVHGDIVLGMIKFSALLFSVQIILLRANERVNLAWQRPRKNIILFYNK